MKTIRMKKADWEKWDAALRSGKYAQAREVLSNGEGGYCCLGVLQVALDGKTEKTKDELPSLAWYSDHGITIVSAQSRRNPILHLRGEPLSAATANDTLDGNGEHVFSFIEIADAVKECVEFSDE